MSLFSPLFVRRHASLLPSEQEAPASLVIPYSHHVDDHTIKTVNGQFMQVLKLGGFAFETEDNDTINIKKIVRNVLWLSLNTSRFGFYAHTIKQRQTVLPLGIQPPGFAHALDAKYKRQLASGAQYVIELYLTIIRKPGEGKARRLTDVLDVLSAKADKSKRATMEAEARADLATAVQTVMTRLRDYEPRLLGRTETEFGKHCELMRLFGTILNLAPTNYIVPRSPLAKILPIARPVFKHEIIELHQTASTKYAGIISIKEYDGHTAPHMTNKLLQQDCEFVLTQSLRPEDRLVSQGKTNKQERQLIAAGDDATMQIEGIADTKNLAASREVAMGLHHFTLMTWADSPAALSLQLGNTAAILGEIGVTGIRESRNLRACFYAQLPGNWELAKPRAARINTANFASYVSLHNFPHGKPTGNHWGNSITVVDSTSGIPHHVNLHRGEKGSTAVLGPNGSGKTLTVSFLMKQRQQFGGRTVYIDKDRGMEIGIRAEGGLYYEVEPGKRTGWNPLKLSDCDRSRAFLREWYESMALATGDPLTSEDLNTISRVVDANYQMPFENRQLRHLAPLFGIIEGNNLAARLSIWYDNPAAGHFGPNAWVFDNEDNSFDLSAANIGIDITHILDKPHARPSTLLWLFYNIEQLIDGTPFVLLVDEGWKALDDPIFVKKLKNFEFVIRKGNGIVIFMTQEPESIIDSAIGDTILQQSETYILFPNPKATREVYCERLMLSEKQYQLIKEDMPALGEPGHFLLKNSQTAVHCRLNMTGMDDEIAILSGRKETVLLLDTIRAEVGNDPKVWLPIFHQRRRRLGVPA